MTNNAKLFELLQQRAAANLAKELNKEEKAVETPLNLSKTTETKEATQTVEEVTNKEVAQDTTETKEATQTTKEDVVETVEEEVTTENVEEEPTDTDSTTGTTEDDKPKGSNAALMAMIAQRQAANTGNGRSNSNTSNNKKEKEVFMYEHVSNVESIIYFNDEEVGRIPKQALIPDANYPKFIRETIIPHIKQASMEQFRFRPQGPDWYLEPNPVYAENFHKQG